MRILGDPLQGIFGFKDRLVDMEDVIVMEDFHKNKQTLTDAWRWKSVNEPLGKDLQQIRLRIETKMSIDFTKYPSIEFMQISDENDIYNPKKNYYRDFNNKINYKNVLIIHPDNTSINTRKKIVGNFRIPITLIESIDDKDFYSISKSFDTINDQNFEATLFAICENIFGVTALRKWINEKKVVNKTNENENLISTELNLKYQNAKKNRSFSDYSNILKYISQLPDVRHHRIELFNNLCTALTEAQANKKSVYEAMLDKRNRVRKMGRKVYGRCIGTTLLTKGLEFETVIILNVDKFTCPKHLYVAITRASKKLIIFGKTKIITPKY